jgi:CRISPR system Cascade subunit CasD
MAAALGLGRDADITPLAALRMGSRTDRPGTWLTDYHTALDVVSSEGKATSGAIVSSRAYIADAAFLVAVEGADPAFLQEIQAALLEPHWPLALGRRAFPPSLPVGFSGEQDPEAIVKGRLEEALSSCPPVVETPDDAVFLYHIEDEGGSQEWFDQPISDFRSRRFSARRVRVVEARKGTPWS